MNEPIIRKFFLHCKEQFLLGMRNLKQVLVKMGGSIFRYARSRGRARVMVLSGLFLFLAVMAWQYYLGPASVEEFTPLLMEETNPTSSQQDIVTLDQLEQEVDALRNKLQELAAPAENSNEEKRNFQPTDFSRPIPGRITRGPGWLRNGKEWRYHSGVDLMLPEGENVLVCADGRITELKSHSTLGTTVRIDHGGEWVSLYGHLKEVCISVGQEVKKGTILGKTSSSTCGPEPGIHFSLFYQGDEVDPRSIIPGL